MTKTLSTLIEVTGVNVTAGTIELFGIDLEKTILSEDIYSEFEQIRFVFDRANRGHMTYIYKVASKKAPEEASFGKQLDALIGKTVILADSFKTR